MEHHSVTLMVVQSLLQLKGAKDSPTAQILTAKALGKLRETIKSVEVLAKLVRKNSKNVSSACNHDQGSGENQECFSSDTKKREMTPNRDLGQVVAAWGAHTDVIVSTQKR